MVALILRVADNFGIKPREAKRFVKFVIVGSIGFLVDFGIFNLVLNPLLAIFAESTAVHQMLLELGLSSQQIKGLVAPIAGTISFIAAIISNFMWNRYWTYPDSRTKSLRRQFAQFTLVSVTAIVIRIPIIAVTQVPFIALAGVMFTGWDIALVERIGKNLALALSVLIVMFWNFFVNRYWTYSDVE
jgi:putative flippase GtrA